MKVDDIREDLLAELARLDARERSLKMHQGRDPIHRLEQVVKERRRLERHLARLERSSGEGAA